MSTVISRKRRVRGGHRSSVKRSISVANDTDLTLENLPILKGSVTSLNEKLSLLRTLDSELLDIVEESEIDEEIATSDEFAEYIHRNIIKLELSISELSRHHGQIETQAQERKDKPSSPAIESVVNHESFGQQALENSGPDNLSQSSSSSTVGVNLSAESVNRTHLKLPKIDLRKFDGNLSLWHTFWDSFEVAIHLNPSLADIDKFSYLNSLLEGHAADAVAGLTLTSANYKEAVDILKRRFGNKQLIINKHMEVLLNIEMTGRNIRHLYDTIESHVRALKSLGVPSTSYGSLLTSILMNKLPNDLRLILSREIKDDDWEFDRLLEMLGREVEARERAYVSQRNPCTQGTSTFRNQSRHESFRKNMGTATFLFTNNQNNSRLYCTYCRAPNHSSNNCNTVSDVSARKQILAKFGRCYVCLKKGHLSRDCSEGKRCYRCNGFHLISLCQNRNHSNSESRPPASYPSGNYQSSYHMGNQTVNSSQSRSQSGNASTNVPGTTLYTSSAAPVLLQTATATAFNTNCPNLRLKFRIIFDSGSQRTYVTIQVKKRLNLPSIGQQTVMIKTFGSDQESLQTVDIVKLNVLTVDEGEIELTAYVVPFICDPIQNQTVIESKNFYQHLSDLNLADYVTGQSDVTVDILIGSDQYWAFVTGRVKRGEEGPIAIQTKLGWVLSGQTMGIMGKEIHSSNMVTTHVLKISASERDNLDQDLNKFWDLESIGIKPTLVYEEFLQKITFNGRHYTVNLPWKCPHEMLPDNYELSHRRLLNLLKRLRQTPEILMEYDSVIRDQIQNGIVEVVPSSTLSKVEVGNVHYIPHHAVLRRDKSTTKLRIVYDASAKSSGPSLNDCLYTGPVLSQRILDIILRFRSYPIALTGDIEKAFLMVRVAEEDRDCLRFLWIDSIFNEHPSVNVLRFSRVVFGVSSSPFLLNATVKHHIETYLKEDPEFVELFMNSIYVDDLSLGADNVDNAFEIYKKSKLRLSEAGFNLRKFRSNSRELRELISQNETESTPLNSEPGKTLVQEEDDTYTKSFLGNKTDGLLISEQKILGICWDCDSDEVVLNLQDVSNQAQEIEPTKRNVISIASRFYDPMGFLSPIIIQFKLLFQELCRNKQDWDSLLEGSVLITWRKLIDGLCLMKPVRLKRCYFDSKSNIISCQLVGFCDASMLAYGAVVYLRVIETNGVYVRFIASRTRVSPIAQLSIPRLELLSALILSRLLVSIGSALEPAIELQDPLCYSDSKVALYWIQQPNKEWKQFVQNRVNEIRSITAIHWWNHCSGHENPADILSRGSNPCGLASNQLWWNGPRWLSDSRDYNQEYLNFDEVEEDCFIELKANQKEKIRQDGLNSDYVLLTNINSQNINNLITCENFSTLDKLLRVTCFVLKFVNSFKSRAVKSEGLQITSQEIDSAEKLWIRDVQNSLRSNENFETWKQQLRLFCDESGILRCGGRLENSELPYSSTFPILLDSGHWFTTLIVRKSHLTTMHGGVKTTLTDVRSRFWILRGCQFIRKLVFNCTICRRFSGKPFKAPESPPLPEFRVKEAPAFTYIGLDYIGPLYLKDSSKVWICLFTCCVTRAVHLELVPNLTPEAFLRCFQRFTARRSVPSIVVSDNATTFKPVSREVVSIMKNTSVQCLFSSQRIKWMFNLAKAPWWGGFYERLVMSVKVCLKKTIGKAKLSYDELLTCITEVESILNSRPLSYLSVDDLDEPLTPSHLITGHRILSLPGIPQDDEFEFNPNQGFY